jgi:magnesium chelatase subunit H
LNELLRTTERVVQEIDSVEYGLTDIQEYYANTGAIVAAANAAKEDAAEKESDSTKPKPAFKKVQCSVVETFGKDAKGSVKDLDETLRLEYRTKLLNPRWAKAMAESGSGGAFEISQRMTALVGWGATTGFTEDWVYDGANETYVEDADMRKLLQKNNPEAFRNVVKRMLEAHGRGMWNADADTIEKLKKMYGDAEDRIEGIL